MSLTFPVGQIVRMTNAPPHPCALWVVVGHDPDGACLTSFLAPPPWMTAAECRSFYAYDPQLLEPVELDLESLELAGAGGEERSRS